MKKQKVLSENSDSKMRLSNFELMRIIMMLGIIAHHYIVNSGITKLYDYSNINSNMIFSQIFGMYGKTIINCFTLITGYFMVNSNITLKKFLKLYLQYKFYYLLFYFIFVLTGYTEFSIDGLLQNVFNVVYEAGKKYYSGVYMIFFLFIPFLNILAKNMTKKQYRIFIFFGGGYMCLIPTLSYFHFKMDTFSFLGWMIITYFIGGYFSLYPNKKTESLRFSLLLMISTIALSIVAVLVIDFYGFSRGFIWPYYFVSNSNRILAIGIAIGVFLFFKNIRIPNSRIINTISASTFGILVIHTCSDLMRKYLWVDVFKCTVYYQKSFKTYVFHSISSVFIVYGVALLIDLLRRYVIEKPFFYYFDKLYIRIKEKKSEG